MKVPGSTVTTLYDYYPVWIQPDGSINFTKVEYTDNSKVPNIALTRVPRLRWVPEGASVPLTQLRMPVRELESVTEHNKAQIKRAPAGRIRQ